MNANDPTGTPAQASGRRPLIWWPLTLIALTTVLLLISHRVSAWHGPDRDDVGSFRRHAERMLDRALDEVDATDAQTVEIRAIGAEIFELVAAAHADGRRDGDALREALSAEPLDRAAIEVIRSAHVERADALSEGIATRLADALEVLNPDQRLRLIARADEFRAHHRDHRGHPGHGGQGGHDSERTSEPPAENGA